MNNNEILKKPDRALFVVDMIKAHIGDNHANAHIESLIGMIAGEIEYFRKKNRPVFYFISEYFKKALNNEYSSLISSLALRPTDIVLMKPNLSCFSNIELEDIMKKLKISRITLSGMQTHTSILATAIDAMARGFTVATPQTCVYSFDQDKHEMALKLIREDYSIS